MNEDLFKLKKELDNNIEVGIDSLTVNYPSIINADKGEIEIFKKDFNLDFKFSGYLVKIRYNRRDKSE